MARITERELILPALYLIQQQPDISTTQLIEKLTDIFQPTGEDAAILSGRRDTKFSQIVRNLVAHHTLDEEKLGFVHYEHRGNNGYFQITSSGVEFLEWNKESLQLLLDSVFAYDERIKGIEQVHEATERGRKVIILDENAIITEGNQKVRVARTRVTERSHALREAAFQHYSDEGGHIRCEVCGFDFWVFYGDTGKGYIEIHHKTPLLQYEDEDRTLFLREAVQRVSPLCANCHRIAHQDRRSVLDINTLRQIVQLQSLKQ